MDRLVTLQVVTPKLHTVPMRTIGRDAAEILLGDAPLGSTLTCLNEVIGNTETEWYSSINAKLFIFLLWLVMHNCILFATVFIIEVPILNFAHIFSGVSCCQSFPAVICLL